MSSASAMSVVSPQCKDEVTTVDAAEQCPSVTQCHSAKVRAEAEKSGQQHQQTSTSVRTARSQ